MEKVFKFLQDNQIFYLATTDGDQPRVRPFGAVSMFEGKMYICTGNLKEVYRQMIANPKVEISAAAPDGRWLRLSAEAVRDDRLEARRAMLESVPSLQNIYKLGDGIFEVFYLKNAAGNICTFTAPPETHKF